MMIYMEKIEPPPIPLTDEEQRKASADAIAEAPVSEDRWVKDFIDRLAVVVRDVRR
jgi:hypothetical protein